MTIALSANTPRVSYTVSQGATQTSFTVNFEFFDAADLNFYVDGTLKTLTTHYTVSGGNGSTGTINTTTGNSVTGISGGSTVVITRSIAFARTTDFPSSGAFEVTKLNNELDRFTAIASDISDETSRSIQLADEDSAVSMELPLLASRKGTVLGFNASTGAVEAGPTIANVNSLSAITANINTVGSISSNVTTVAGIEANVTTVAGISGNVTSVANNATNINAVNSNSSNINTVAGNNSNITTLAGIDSNVTTVAGIANNVTTVAGKASLITSAFSNGMSLVTSDFVSDVNTLAVTDVINDINTLATSDIVADLNQLATTDIVTDLSLIANSDVINDLNTLATTDIISDINTLATNDIVSDLNLLATSDFVSDLNTIATSTNINNLDTVATNISNVNTVAGNNTNINSVNSNESNINTVSTNIANVNTVATNVSSINSFSERYRIASSNPTTSLDVGDLYFNTSDNELRTYNGSAWQTTAVSPALQNNINIVAGEITSSEDLGSITDSIDTSSGNNIDTVANNITNVNAVGGVSANVTTLANNISSINSVASTVGGSQTYTVTVANVGGQNVFVLGSNNNPAITLTRGFTYVFDQSHSSNAGHPLAFKNGSSSYTTGVTVTGTAGQAGAKVTFVVPTDAPASGLLYYCTVHGNAMGNTIATSQNDIAVVVANIDAVNGFAARYRVASSAPSLSLDAGDLYYNTSTNTLNYYNGSSFVAVVAGAMTSLAIDTTPQLGGNLDVNGNSIVSVSNGHITIAPNGSGEIKLNGTVNTDNLTIDFGSIA